MVSIIIVRGVSAVLGEIGVKYKSSMRKGCTRGEHHIFYTFRIEVTSLPASLTESKIYMWFFCDLIVVVMIIPANLGNLKYTYLGPGNHFCCKKYEERNPNFDSIRTFQVFCSKKSIPPFPSIFSVLLLATIPLLQHGRKRKKEKENSCISFSLSLWV